MSHTNSTTNYQLPQFVGSDKPAWLTDVNQGYSTIDTQMKTNATAAATAQSTATSANTKIGTLSDLTTDAQTDLVSAINEVDAHANTAQTTANSASSAASTAQSTANSISDYLSMNITGSIETRNIAISAGSIGSFTLNYASNTDGTLGKLYGHLVNVSIPSPTTITISNLPFTITSQFSVQGLALVQDSSTKEIYGSNNVTFNTNGTVTMYFDSSYSNKTIKIYMLPVLLFIKNFGD